MTQPSDMNYPPPQDASGYPQQPGQQQYQQQYTQYAAPQYGYGYPNQQQFYMEPKHSGFGIASLIMGIFVGLLELGLVVVAGMMAVKAGPSGMDEKAPETIALGLLLLGGLLVALFGAVVGIIGCFQANRKKVFAILGTVINGLILLLVVGLMVLGFAMK